MLKLEFWFTKDHHKSWFVVGDPDAIWCIAWLLRVATLPEDVDYQVTSVRTQLRVKKLGGLADYRSGA